MRAFCEELVVRSLFAMRRIDASTLAEAPEIASPHA